MPGSHSQSSPGLLTAALVIIALTIGLVIMIANGWHPNIGGLAGPIALLFIFAGRAQAEGNSRPPDRPATRPTAPRTRPRPRPDQDPLWDRWLDGPDLNDVALDRDRSSPK